MLPTFFTLYMNLKPPLSCAFAGSHSRSLPPTTPMSPPGSHPLSLPAVAHALGCLVQLASVRRTLFTADQRQHYLEQLLTGICQILRSNQGFEDHGTAGRLAGRLLACTMLACLHYACLYSACLLADNYHEFCRLLARLKTNYQLLELVSSTHYEEGINGIAAFTVVSLTNWHYAPNRYWGWRLGIKGDWMETGDGD